MTIDRRVEIWLAAMMEGLSSLLAHPRMTKRCNLGVQLLVG